MIQAALTAVSNQVKKVGAIGDEYKVRQCCQAAPVHQERYDCRQAWPDDRPGDPAATLVRPFACLLQVRGGVESFAEVCGVSAQREVYAVLI